MARAHLVSRSWTSVVLLAALAAPSGAQAPQILAVLPPFGSPGSEVLIVGSGFASDVAPRVWLEFPAADPADEPVHHRLRVLDWSDSEIHAKVLSGEAGNGLLMVSVLHQETVSAVFKVLKPQVVSFVPQAASPGDMVTVKGASFGPKRGKVMLFDRPCKVVEWADDSVVFKVPNNLANGEWTPRVSNSVGEAVAFSALKLSGSQAELPAPFVDMQVEGLPFVAGPPDVVAKDLVTKVSFDAWSSLDGVDRHLKVVVNFKLLTSKVPTLFTGGSAAAQPVFFEMLPPAGSLEAASVYVAGPPSLPWRVHVLGRSQGQLFGLMSAVLKRVSGPGPETLALDEGMFLVDP